MNCPHCQTKIDEHEAGRCLDAWVAEAVMGWTAEYFWPEPSKNTVANWTHPTEEDYTGGPGAYSTSIAAAWEVVGRLVPEAGAEWAIGIFAVPSISSVMWGWQVELQRSVYPPNRGEGEISARAETFQLAVCRAALKAVNDTRKSDLPSLDELTARYAASTGD